MGKEVQYKIKPGSTLTAEQIAMIEAAKDLPTVQDEDNPEIDPVTTPEQYKALMKAVGERNRRVVMRQKEMA